jgi:valyl-tRNA synthetase
MYAIGSKDSIHISTWPEYDASMVDEEFERAGDIISGIMGEVRKQKNKLGIPLNKPVKRLVVYAVDEKVLADVRLGDRDIRETLKIQEITYCIGSGGTEVEGHAGISLTLTL